MILVRGSSTRLIECKYILEVIFTEFLGVQWRYETIESVDFHITIPEHLGEIRLPNILLNTYEREWLSEASLPQRPLCIWDSSQISENIDLVAPTIPVIYGDVKALVDMDSDILRLPLDIFGSAFFMISRYEEIVKTDKDNYGRFPASASLAKQEGFLDRPIIDEYVEILWGAMQLLWPQLQRKPKEKQLRVTCDVDSPYISDFSKIEIIKGVCRDILKKFNFRLAFTNLRRRIRSRQGDYSYDPHYSQIQWMMDINEQAGNKMSFYFITGGEHKFDGRYLFNDKVIRDMLLRIHDRGHEIGLHPSFETYLDQDKMLHEANVLREIMCELDIPNKHLGGRQHYLRWQTPDTANQWESAGMEYDSTLCFAEAPGFRCGTSREYTMFNCILGCALKLKQRPLILMETSVFSNSYLGLGRSDESLDYILSIKNRALKIGGECTVLWHNSTFNHPLDKTFYTALISQ